MIRLFVVVEGDSELVFVNQVLREHLLALDVDATAIKVTTCLDEASGRYHKGGGCKFSAVRRDIKGLLHSPASDSVRVTTMLDLYALPTDHPGYDASRQLKGVERVRLLEESMAREIDHWRFIPYIQLHEFEALLLVAPEYFGEYYPNKQAVSALLATVGDAPPEEINDRPTEAPSKRILRHFPAYAREKPLASNLILTEIGLQRIRDRCPHFAGWLTQLEELSPNRAA